MALQPSDTIQALQRALRPYVRSREEIAHIRHILAAHLSSCVGGERGEGILALPDASCAVSQKPEVRGLQRDYVEAVSANIRAREEFETVQRAHVQSVESTPLRDRAASDRLEDHIVRVNLRKKREALETVNRYLDLLSQQPPAAEDFLDPAEIFRNAIQLPEVPEGVVSGCSVDKDATRSELKDLISRLEKRVLQAKLLLAKESQALENARSRSTSLPERISDSVRLQALGASRRELIAWIESELGKVSSSESEVPGEVPLQDRKPAVEDKAHMDDQLASVKEKYTRYVTVRKSLIQTVSQRSQPVVVPQLGPADHVAAQSLSHPPATYLLSPYLEGLLAVAHEQKGLIAQKSYLNIALAKQLKDTYQVIDHLAEESQLLPSFPLPGSSKRKPGLGEGLAAPESLDATSRMKSWVFAADSAKIATLESVAEKVEEGQLALEDSMKILGEVDRLLGRSRPDGQSVEADATEDIWLAQAKPGAAPKAKKRADKEAARQGGGEDVWSVLDGNLGLIRSEDDM